MGPAQPGRRRKRAATGAETPGDSFIWDRGARSQLEITLTFFGVFLFMAVIITYRFPVGNIAVAAALIGMLMDRKGIIFPRFLLLMIAFVIWCWLGTFTTRYPGPAQESTLQLAKTGLIWWAAIAAVRTRAQFRWGMIILVFLYASHPIRGGIFNILVYGHSLQGRTVWNHIFSNPNDYAGFTMLFLSIAAGLLITERKGLVRLGAAASCVVFPIMIIYTQSRANFLALAFFGFAIFAGQKKKARALGGLALVAVAAFITVPADAWQRLGTAATLAGGEEAADIDDSGSANERLEIWRVATKVAKDNFVTGTGWGTYEYAHHETSTTNRDLFPYFIGRNTYRDAHNTYLTVLAETGLPGFLLWFGSIVTVLVYAEKRRRRFDSIAPNAARQILFLEYGLVAYGIAAIWGSYAAHSFLYLHLTWIWVAASILEKDCVDFIQSGGSGMRPNVRRANPAPGQQQRPVAGLVRPRPRFNPDLVGYPLKSDASPAS